MVTHARLPHQSYALLGLLTVSLDHPKANTLIVLVQAGSCRDMPYNSTYNTLQHNYPNYTRQVDGPSHLSCLEIQRETFAS